MNISTNLEKCCGCAVCEYVCPRKCITFTVDKNGFNYPRIDKDNCIDCGLCVKKCPVSEQRIKEHQSSTKCFAVRAKDSVTVEQSSSGGFFSVLAEWVINHGGLVVGAAFDEKLNVVHRIVEDIEELYLIRGSKYVQSDMSAAIRYVAEYLAKDRYVLFSGTSCQVQSIINCFKGKYPKLLTADIICHGAPTPKLWQEYLNYQGKLYHSKVIEASFRDKHFGWLDYSVCLKFENGKVYRKKAKNDPYMRLFLQNSFLRESCYQCQFKKLRKNSDFTMSDYWMVSRFCPEFNDDRGTSLIYVHSDSGIEIFNSIKDKLMISEVTEEEALFENYAVEHATQYPANRQNALERLGNESFMKMYKRVCIPLWRDKFRRLKYKIRQARYK